VAAKPPPDSPSCSVPMAQAQLQRWALVFNIQHYRPLETGHTLAWVALPMEESLLAVAFGKSAVPVRLRGRNSRPRSGNFGLRLRDPTDCPVDFGLLQLFLAPVILDGGFCRCHARIRLGYLRLVIAVLQFEQQVAFLQLLVVSNVHRADNAGHLSAKRGKITADVSVVGNLFRFAAFPGIPVPDKGNEDSKAE
jgi:hypothetical protein